MKDAQDKVTSIQAKILSSQSRQKKFAYHKVMGIKFNIILNILLRVSPMKEVMRYCKKEKLIL